MNLKTTTYAQDYYKDFQKKSKDEPLITEIPKNSSSKNSIEETEKIKLEFLNMFLTELKLQDHEQAADTSQMTTVLAQISQVEAGNETNRLLEVIASNYKSDIIKAKEYNGLEVYYDNKEKELAGDELIFDYEVENASTIHNASRLNLKFEILDTRGNTVFRDEYIKEFEKKGRIKWNGKNSYGKAMPKEKYNISITADVIDGQGGKFSVPITTAKKGIVKEIINKNGKAYLSVNEDLILPEEISKIPFHNNTAGHSGEYIKYIGKKVSVKDDTINVKNGFAEFEYNNTIKNPGNVMIKIKDHEDKLIAVASPKGKPLEGKNKYIWDGKQFTSLEQVQEYHKSAASALKVPKVADGNYKYELFIENLDEVDKSKKFVQQDLNIQGLIEAVSSKDNRLTVKVNGKDYNINDITEIENYINHAQNLAEEAALYIGKMVRIHNNKFNVDAQHSMIKFRLPEPSKNTVYKQLDVKIFDSNNNFVNSIKVAANKINFLGSQTPPKYEELSNDSVDKINKYLKSNYDKEYSDLNENQKAELQNYISHQYYSGMLLTKEQAKLDPHEQTKELSSIMGFNALEWNTKNINGENVKKGAYNFKIEATKLNIKTLIEENEEIESFTEGIVKEAVINGNEYSLMLDTGRNISKQEIVRIASPYM